MFSFYCFDIFIDSDYSLLEAFFQVTGAVLVYKYLQMLKNGAVICDGQD